MSTPRLTREGTTLLVVDIQERLLPVIADAERLLRRSVVAVQIARALRLPVLLTEQYPKGLGRTVPEVVDALGDAYRPVEKTTFSACGDDGVGDALRATNARNVLLVGIEAHVCVLQTALDLLDGGYRVFPVADAISSRHAEDRSLGLERMRQNGAQLVSTEMLLFELLGASKDPNFRTLQNLIR